jgi:hypothetical protein
MVRGEPALTGAGVCAVVQSVAERKEGGGVGRNPLGSGRSSGDRDECERHEWFARLMGPKMTLGRPVSCGGSGSHISVQVFAVKELSSAIKGSKAENGIGVGKPHRQGRTTCVGISERALRPSPIESVKQTRKRREGEQMARSQRAMKDQVSGDMRGRMAESCADKAAWRESARVSRGGKTEARSDALISSDGGHWERLNPTRGGGVEIYIRPAAVRRGGQKVDAYPILG